MMSKAVKVGSSSSRRGGGSDTAEAAAGGGVWWLGKGQHWEKRCSVRLPSSPTVVAIGSTAWEGISQPSSNRSRL
jgi:hypothetical protein